MGSRSIDWPIAGYKTASEPARGAALDRLEMPGTNSSGIFGALTETLEEHGEPIEHRCRPVELIRGEVGEHLPPEGFKGRAALLAHRSACVGQACSDYPAILLRAHALDESRIPEPVEHLRHARRRDVRHCRQAAGRQFASAQ